MKQTIFDNINNYTTNIDLDPTNANPEAIKANKKTIHTAIVQYPLYDKPYNRLLNRLAPNISPTNRLSHDRRDGDLHIYELINLLYR